MHEIEISSINDRCVSYHTGLSYHDWKASNVTVNAGDFFSASSNGLKYFKGTICALLLTKNCLCVITTMDGLPVSQRKTNNVVPRKHLYSLFKQ
jgi:hypothetical protein